MLFLILAGALQIEMPPLAKKADIAVLLEAAEDLKGILADLDVFLVTGIREGLDTPRVGIFMGVSTERGEDGLHTVMVLGVNPDSPAYRVGVKPGDRILRIDKRRLEHEPYDIVRTLLSSGSGSMTLTLQRDQNVLEVTLIRQVIPCIQEAMDAVDIKEYQRRLNSMQALLMVTDAGLREPELSQAAAESALNGLKTISKLLDATLDRLNVEIVRTTLQACQVEHVD